MKVYGDIRSGNCYKIKLLASLLDIDHDWVAMDILAGETKSQEFLAKNPNGKIPLLELDDGQLLAESNAVLNYLAWDTELLPADRYNFAKVLQWQFFEQYSHEPFIAVARFIAHFLDLPEDRRAEYHSKQKGGHKALAIMNSELSNSSYLVGEKLTVADISLYGYTHVADEGGFDLGQYPAINAWLERISSLDKYISMKD